jgi:hypothetical protein
MIHVLPAPDNPISGVSTLFENSQDICNSRWSDVNVSEADGEKKQQCLIANTLNCTLFWEKSIGVNCFTRV